MRWLIVSALAGLGALAGAAPAAADESLLGGWSGALVCEDGTAFAIDLVFTDASNGAAAGVVRWVSEDDLLESKARLAPESGDAAVMLLVADSTMDVLRLVRDGDRMVGAPAERAGCSVTLSQDL